LTQINDDPISAPTAYTDQGWEPFRNGDTGHTYSIYYLGKGNPVRFRLYDWVDLNMTNNSCHIPVSIYRVTVGGEIVTPNPPTLLTQATMVTLALSMSIIRVSRHNRHKRKSWSI